MNAVAKEITPGPWIIRDGKLWLDLPTCRVEIKPAQALGALNVLVAALQEIAEKATGTNPDFRMSVVRKTARAALAKVSP